MTGTITSHNKAGERLYTIYLGAAPEYGKTKFLQRLEREIYSIKLQYPEATYVCIADGAKANWEFLKHYAQCQVLDFFHATQYLANVSHAIHPVEAKQSKAKQSKAKEGLARFSVSPIET